VQSINWGEEKEEGTQLCLEVLKQLECLLMVEEREEGVGDYSHEVLAGGFLQRLRNSTTTITITSSMRAIPTTVPQMILTLTTQYPSAVLRELKQINVLCVPSYVCAHLRSGDSMIMAKSQFAPVKAGGHVHV